MTKFREINGFYDLPDSFMVFADRDLFHSSDTIVNFVKVSETEAGIRYQRVIQLEHGRNRTHIISENGFIPIDWAMKIGDRQLCLHFLETMNQAEIDHATEMAEDHQFVWDLFGIN